MKARQTGLVLLALGVLGSQAGHLVAYQVRFGAAAQQLQSGGSHAYFPGVVKTAMGLLAAAVLGTIFVAGLARVVGKRPLSRTASAPSLLRLVAALFTIQLAVFVVQETAEAAASGAKGGSITTLLLWGGLGQLPVAVAGAIALRWLLVRFEAAVDVIRVALSAPPPRAHVVAALSPVIAAGGNSPLRSQLIGAARPKRGPPPSWSLFAQK